MGAQIAQQAALHGIEAILQDQDQAQLRKARDSNEGHLARRVEKGKLSREDMNAALGRVQATADLYAAVERADFVIEAVFEDIEVKRSIFKALDDVAPPGAVLASNSSTMGITKIAEVTHRPDRCLNMHFSIRCW
jgi:3-hydroxybutyryl-CoA dehydrogenase